MRNSELNSNKKPSFKSGNNEEIISRIEAAYKIYKLSEVFLSNVSDDYGKQKIARLRYEFSKHELMAVLQEASEKGIKWHEVEVLGKLFYPDS